MLAASFLFILAKVSWFVRFDTHTCPLSTGPEAKTTVNLMSDSITKKRQRSRAISATGESYMDDIEELPGRFVEAYKHHRADFHSFSEEEVSPSTHWRFER